MSKNYQKAAIRCIFALAVLIAGTCYIAATAWATTCFLPSGNCSTGRVGNEDKPNPNPDPTPGPTPEDECKDFKNNSTKSEYDWKNKTSCFVCTTCTSNGNTKYNCVKNSGYSWDSSDGGHCCVSGEKWYSKMGMCCSATSGCTCPTLKKWSNGECVCQYAKTSTGTCCEKGKIADKHLCCNAGEHAENTICCPANKHEEGGECKCDENYIPDGTGCKKKELACTYEYRQATTADSDNKTGNLDDGYRCTVNSKCYYTLNKVTSLYLGGGTPTANPINQISNESATCVDDKGITKYQTLCKGTPKSRSTTMVGFEYKSNGCVSSGYNNGFTVKGDEWGDCVIKEEKCFYEYRQATASDSDNKTGNLDYPTYKCTNGSQCWKNLRNITSLSIRAGTPSVNPINKISNKSASCTTLNGVTKYETICEGTTKSDCFTFNKDKKFTPNGCVSDAYNNGFEVKGDEWGTCGGCDTDKGAYDTIEECRSGTKSGCMSSGGCYKTCASQGYFSTEAGCKNTNYRVTCSKIGDCYNREMPGFAIRYASFPNRTWSCSGPIHGQTLQTFRAWLANVNIDSSGRHSVGYYAKSIDGIDLSELSDENQYYEPGTYFVCASRGSGVVGISRTVVQYARDMNGGDPTTQVCFADTISSQFNSQNCEKTQESGNGFGCKEVTFQKNKLYLISMYSNYGHPGWGYYQGTCSNSK